MTTKQRYSEDKRSEFDRQRQENPHRAIALDAVSASMHELEIYHSELVKAYYQDCDNKNPQELFDALHGIVSTCAALSKLFGFDMSRLYAGSSPAPRYATKEVQHGSY